MIFSKVFKKPKLNFISSKFEFPNRFVWSSQNGLKVSGVANLASNCDCSSLYSFPDVTFFVFFFKKISENLNLFFLQILEFIAPVVGSRQSTPIAKDLSSNCGCSNFLVVFVI